MELGLGLSISKNNILLNLIGLIYGSGQNTKIYGSGANSKKYGG